MTFFQEVYEVLKKLPDGRVTTYGQIARLLGNPRMSRQVGWALHGNPEPGVIPCHRVVNRFGKLCKGFAFGGEEVQRALLLRDGIAVSEDFSVDLTRYLWEI